MYNEFKTNNTVRTYIVRQKCLLHDIRNFAPRGEDNILKKIQTSSVGLGEERNRTCYSRPPKLISEVEKMTKGNLDIERNIDIPNVVGEFDGHPEKARTSSSGAHDATYEDSANSTDICEP